MFIQIPSKFCGMLVHLLSESDMMSDKQTYLQTNFYENDNSGITVQKNNNDQHGSSVLMAVKTTFHSLRDKDKVQVLYYTYISSSVG
jgi:hypothetical protein